ncbi:excalibur calcium-binding domain-containing protein [Streptomyces virginiae]|uniref:excalibur calcium-binding domain-containing protein n=1 Tax=Streptomyces virginiae TaxID=1961 RepID=UPI00363FE97F
MARLTGRPLLFHVHGRRIRVPEPSAAAALHARRARARTGRWHWPSRSSSPRSCCLRSAPHWRVHYKNCAAAKAAHAAPVRRGDPGYGHHLDRDGAGVACE